MFQTCPMCNEVWASREVFLSDPQEAFYTWQLRDYQRVESKWTPYYKVDYLTFEEDQCLGAVHNMILVWCTWSRPDRALLIYQRLAQVLGEGAARAARVLALGRTNGHFPSAMRLRNPHLERLLAVEYDPVITADLREGYARYNGAIFSEDRIEVSRTFLCSS